MTEPTTPGDTWEMPAITEAGVYDLPASVYHLDPVAAGSLSSTGARRLLPPGCPAKFKWEQDHGGRGDKTYFDVGRATHADILGVGDPIALIDADSWRTKAAQAARDEARAAGKTPLLASDYKAVRGMTRAVLNHPTAGALLQPGRGHREQVLVAQDPDTGVWLRAMLDLHDELDGIGPVVVDVKTTVSAEPSAIAGSIERYGYHQQDVFYSDVYTALTGVEPTFLFVFVEKEPPHLVTVYQLTDADRARGRERNRKAIEIYRRCVETGHWPGYSDDIVLNDAPGWAVSQHEAAWRRGAFDTTTHQIGAA